MTVASFTKQPTRAIYARRARTGHGWWVAEFAGDPWRKAFVLADGSKRGLLEAITDPAVRAGLPIVIAEPRARRKAGGGQ
ncbi:MAG: hypothetical protein H5U21_08985 [Porphyrobacter sp.]|nr:hypothetical protein [Porphyrobacter sp.]